MTILAPLAVQSFRDNNGNPLAGGLLYTYAAGTSTPQTTYQDSAGASPNANPVVLNSRGEAQVWLTVGQAYKFVLQDSLANVIWTVDNINGATLTSATGQIAGLIPSTAGASTTISVSSGQAADSGSAALMPLAATMSKTTSAWAVGSANGGLDTGAIANSTKYYLWLIQRLDTSVVDVLISLSPTTPTMPTSYTLKRLIGFGVTNGSAQWTSFIAYETAGGGVKYIWPTPFYDINTNTLTTARQTYVPTGTPAVRGVEMEWYGDMTNGGTSCNVWVGSPDQTDAVPSQTTTGLSFATTAAGAEVVGKFTTQGDATAQVAARSTAASTVLRCQLVGFSWSRR